MAAILAVDDDPVQRELYGVYLAAIASKLVAVGSGEAALGELAWTNFDVAVVDYDMPGMNGLELVRRLRTDPRFGPRPILVVTGRDDLVSGNLATEAGATGLVYKPVRWRELAERVAGLVGR